MAVFGVSVSDGIVVGGWFGFLLVGLDVEVGEEDDKDSGVKHEAEGNDPRISAVEEQSAD